MVNAFLMSVAAPPFLLPPLYDVFGQKDDCVIFLVASFDKMFEEWQAFVTCGGKAATSRKKEKEGLRGKREK